MRLLGPAIADWYTCAPSETEYKFKTGDLSSAIEEAVANQRKAKTTKTHDEVVKELKEIKKEIERLGKDLKKNGILVPNLPTKNSFGLEGKHVFKTEIKQTHAPDPIVLAVKGVNNLLRQWGKRLLPGCPSHDVVSLDGSSSPSHNVVSLEGSSSGSSSVAGASAATPTDFVGKEITAIVTPPSDTVRAVANADDTASDNDTFSDISADDMPCF